MKKDQKQPLLLGRNSKPSFKSKDIILYPEVVVDSPFYCDCKINEYIKNSGIMQIGPHYCPKHNVIILEVILDKINSARIIESEVVQIINHETIHWILCKDFGESISMNFDFIFPTLLDLV